MCILYYYYIKKKQQQLFTSAYELRKKIVVCLLRTTQSAISALSVSKQGIQVKLSNMLLEQRQFRKVPDPFRQQVPYLRANIRNRSLPPCVIVFNQGIVPQWIFGVCPLEKVSNVSRTNIILNLVDLTELAKTWLKKFQVHCDGRFFHFETNLRFNGNSVLDSR